MVERGILENTYMGIFWNKYGRGYDERMMVGVLQYNISRI